VLLSFKHTELVSVALVNRVYQAEAERLLYRSIGWRFTPERLLSCLQTLVAAKSKAALVKSLVVTTISSVLQPILAQFVEALGTCLPNMTSLTSLRLHFPHTTTEYVATRLNPVLKYVFIPKSNTIRLTPFFFWD
jgi:hypothetical protein